ncbi:hypothetical protein L1887_18018 [Cichorium endivia]|nr:hypothetical protein L1887_18018 [Cichorium endivia]
MRILTLSLSTIIMSDFFWLAESSRFVFGGLDAASTLSVIIVVIYGANLTIAGSMSPGSLTSFILYSLTVGTFISGLSSIYTVAMKVAGAGTRVFKLLDRVYSMPESGKKCPLGDDDAEVELDDVWICCSRNHQILKNVDDHVIREYPDTNQ